MKTNIIYNESNLDTLSKMNTNSIDVILTSPFYNTNKKAGKKSTLMNTKVKKGQYEYVRYDVFVDTMSEAEYFDYIIGLFSNFDKVLKKDGSILWNISYGQDGAASMLRLIAAITEKTNFTCADIVTWHKKSALPNSCSPNKLTRICEYIFVFCRKSEFYTFHMNKQVLSVRKNTNQKMYSSVPNYIEAKIMMARALIIRLRFRLIYADNFCLSMLPMVLWSMTRSWGVEQRLLLVSS